MSRRALGVVLGILSLGMAASGASVWHSQRTLFGVELDELSQRVTEAHERLEHVKGEAGRVDEWVADLDLWSRTVGVHVADRRVEVKPHEAYDELVLTLRLDGPPEALDHWLERFHSRELGAAPRPLNRMMTWHTSPPDIAPPEFRVSLYRADLPDLGTGRRDPCRLKASRVWLWPYPGELAALREGLRGPCAELARLKDVDALVHDVDGWTRVLTDRERLAGEIWKRFQ